MYCRNIFGRRKAFTLFFVFQNGDGSYTLPRKGSIFNSRMRHVIKVRRDIEKGNFHFFCRFFIGVNFKISFSQLP